MKIGLVYNDEPRPETTGFYCRRALAPLVDVEHLLPHELELIDPAIFDVFVFVDDGLNAPIPEHCRPRVAWAIDTHIHPDRILHRFGDADILFAAQKNGAAALSAALGRPVEWLPLACDPDIHAPVPGESVNHDLVFVGHAVGMRRIEMLQALSQRYPNSWFGQAVFEDMARMYSRGRVGFNCSVADDLNMRLFEIPACGIPLVTNAIHGNGLEELFVPNQHLLLWDTEDELYACVDRLLADPKRRQHIAAAARAHVCERHTYRQRMIRVLQAIDGLPRKVSFQHTTREFERCELRHSATKPDCPSLRGDSVRSSDVDPGHSGKSTEYFEFDRPDVRSLIPKEAIRILDVGCASGRLGQALKRERTCHVTGIEAEPHAAARARHVLDHVDCVSIDTVSAEHFPAAAFDCIVFADVLEHLRNPLAVLRKCGGWLTEHGHMVVSVPNNRHHSVISGLIDGNWTYERAGLLDDDHVRCFTRRELEKLLFRAGFDVTARVAIPGPGYEEWRASGQPSAVNVGRLRIDGLDPIDAEEFFVYQHLVCGQRAPRPDYGITSVIIVTFNQLWCTRLCVDSLRCRTDEPIELIFVDNGSTDGTPEYLQSIPNARVILNSTNRGFAPAVNQGLQVATGRQILLLNNDCIVTTGWLSGLLEALHDNPSNGLVGPVSNNVSGPQQIPVSYTDLTSLDGFAWDCRRRRQLTQTDRLVGFCLLFRREVLDAIGMLDEQFQIGCFEDDDFCRRAQAAGFRSLMAQHVFVHHFGSATFRGAGFDLGQILQENEQRYRQKWQSTGNPASLPAPQTTSVNSSAPQYLLHRLDDGSSLLQRTHIRLSLCMIVRDNADTIEACLDSIYPWVDEIIIVDTGSKDRTPDICRRFGARMFEFPWCDDFSAARNKSLEPARGEWIFWMDSDDVIDQEQGRKLRDLVYGNHRPDCLGYVAQVHCISAEPGQLTVVDHVKIFRNRPELRFEHRIHEQILPAIRREGGNVLFTDIFVTHMGSIQTPETRQRKLERDFRILRLDLNERPDHPFILFNLGMTYEDAGKYSEAEGLLQKCLAVSQTDESHVPKAWALLINCLRQQNRLADAVATATDAILRYPDDRELRFRRASAAHEAGDLNAARSDYELLLNTSPARVFQSLDPGICGHKALNNLAIICEQQGEDAVASEYWKRAVAECPEFSCAWLSLVRCLSRLGRIEEARHAFLQMQQHSADQELSALASASIEESAINPSTAFQTLTIEFERSGSVHCLDEMARIMVNGRQFAAAIPPLQELNSRKPGDPSVLYNLAACYSQLGDLAAARDCATRSLQIRRQYPAAVQLLEELEGRISGNLRHVESGEFDGTHVL